MKKTVYDPWGEMLTEYGRYRLYMFIARKQSGNTGYVSIRYDETARALGLQFDDVIRHAIELALWSLHGDRHGKIRAVWVKRGKNIDRDYKAMLGASVYRLREEGFTRLADLYESYGG